MATGVTILANNAGVYKKIDVSDTAQGLSQSDWQPTTGKFMGLTAKEMYITCEDNTVHWTCDGTTPTPTAGTNVGHKLYPGSSIVLKGLENIKNFQVINETAGSNGTLKITIMF